MARSSLSRPRRPARSAGSEGGATPEVQRAPEPARVKAVDLDAVRAAIGPVATRHGLELVDVEWGTDGAGRVLRVYIERAGASGDESGVTLDDCADVSRDASVALDVSDLIPSHYNLEVSSPGLERKLRGARDFERFAGKLAKLKLTVPAPDGQRVLRGRLDGVSADSVSVIADGRRFTVPFASVGEAHLVFDPASEGAPSPKRTSRPGSSPRDSSQGKRGPPAPPKSG